jgi:general secretion pathway protein K
MMFRLINKLKLEATPLCEALTDWIDENDLPQPTGAESAWYKRLKPPYQPRNARLETLEELGLVRGFSGVALQKLRPFVTVYAETPSAPAAPVNINTAPLEVLVALHEQMDEDLGKRIIEYRRTTPFKNPAELSKVAGMESISTSLLTRITTKGNVYRIHSQARVGEVTRLIEAVVRTSGSQLTVIYWREY